MTKSPDFLTLTQVAEELHLSRRAVSHRIEAGKISASKIGTGRTSAYVVSRDEVDRLKSEAAEAAARDIRVLGRRGEDL